jgi:hypothetical protein
MRSQGFSESREAKGRTKASTQSIRFLPGVSVSMARSKSPHQTPNFLVGGLKNFLFTSCSPLPLCAQIANLDQEVFGIDCNCVARPWRV